ncbi:acyl-ACP--UDP-N-acetylglucosamine O-acyltransferase [candidate division KSB1 bacterium]|nr:acyl-ACP--UDP-N-acetylglucosamine O-acyltransferase [candidate division KSB1 bacterium]
MAKIHATAIVNKKAELAEDVEVGPFTIIEEDVTINSGTIIASNVLISDGARIGKNCKIFNGAVLSTAPQDLKYKGEKTTLEVGDNTIIREFCTLNRGTDDKYKTEIGSDCLLMAYVHVAHDCFLGNKVVLANAVNLAGHIVIEEFASVGGMDPIHQFVRIGQHSFIGGGLRVDKDVPPYILAAGEPLTFAGLNIVGLTRRGFAKETLTQLKKTYKIVYRSKLNVSQAITRIKEDVDLLPEVKNVIEFIEKSQRGIIK